MFKHAVNAACINKAFTAQTIAIVSDAPMHPQTVRIYIAMQSVLRLDREPTPTEVYEALKSTAQVMTNWHKRVPSAKGLLAAQKLHGINASWITSGEGPMFVPHGSTIAAEPAPMGLVPTAGETDLLLAFRTLPPSLMKDYREAILNAAAKWTEDLQAVMKRNGVTGTASDARVAAVLPPRPDGDQPDTRPGMLDAPSNVPHSKDRR